MIRARVILIGGVPHLHVTRPGAPAETRPMESAELVRLMEEVARAVLVGFRNQDEKISKSMQTDDPPPHYVGALGE